MNDNLKIQALMVYFLHWGKEENKAQRDLDAFITTMNKIKELFIDHNIEFHHDFDFLQEVKLMNSWIHYGPDATMDFINRMANKLLSSMGGCNDMLYYRPLSSPIKLSKTLDISVFDIFALGLDDDDMLSVDAIVALL